MSCSRISIDISNQNGNHLASLSTNGNVYLYCGALTHFTIDDKGVWLHNFTTYDQTSNMRVFHEKVKCYKHKDGDIYVKIGGKCYVTCIAPSWMIRESIFC
jgi:hypothetical protein